MNTELGKCPKGFEPHTLQIESQQWGGEKYKTDVESFALDDLAIHKRMFGWGITHIRSGRLVFEVNTKKQAIRATRKILKALDFNLALSTIQRRKKEYNAVLEKIWYKVVVGFDR